MGFGRKEQKKARRAAEDAGREARALRAEVSKKDAAERLRVQRKLIRGVRGSMNPFSTVDTEATLGDPGTPGNQEGAL